MLSLSGSLYPKLDRPPTLCFEVFLLLFLELERRKKNIIFLKCYISVCLCPPRQAFQYKVAANSFKLLFHFKKFEKTFLYQTRNDLICLKRNMGTLASILNYLYNEMKVRFQSQGENHY